MIDPYADYTIKPERQPLVHAWVSYDSQPRWTLRQTLAFCRTHRIAWWRRAWVILQWLPRRGRNISL